MSCCTAGEYIRKDPCGQKSLTKALDGESVIVSDVRLRLTLSLSLLLKVKVCVNMNVRVL